MPPASRGTVGTGMPQELPWASVPGGRVQDGFKARISPRSARDAAMTPAQHAVCHRVRESQTNWVFSSAARAAVWSPLPPLPAKAEESNSERALDNQFLIKKTPAVGTGDAQLHRPEAAADLPVGLACRACSLDRPGAHGRSPVLWVLASVHSKYPQRVGARSRDTVLKKEMWFGSVQRGRLDGHQARGGQTQSCICKEQPGCSKKTPEMTTA